MPARNKKGQFVKGGGRRRSSRGSTALVRRGSSSVVVVRQPSSGVPTRRSRRGGGGGGGAGMKSRRIGLLKGGFIIGVAEKNYGTEFFDKIPAIKGSKYATIAAVGHFALKARSGTLLGDITDAATALTGKEAGAMISGGILSGDDATWE